MQRTRGKREREKKTKSWRTQHARKLAEETEDEEGRVRDLMLSTGIVPVLKDSGREKRERGTEREREREREIPNMEQCVVHERACAGTNRVPERCATRTEPFLSLEKERERERERER